MGRARRVEFFGLDVAVLAEGDAVLLDVPTIGHVASVRDVVGIKALTQTQHLWTHTTPMFVSLKDSIAKVLADVLLF